MTPEAPKRSLDAPSEAAHREPESLIGRLADIRVGSAKGITADRIERIVRDADAALRFLEQGDTENARAVLRRGFQRAPVGLREAAHPSGAGSGTLAVHLRTTSRALHGAIHARGETWEECQDEPCVGDRRVLAATPTVSRDGEIVAMMRVLCQALGIGADDDTRQDFGDLFGGALARPSETAERFYDAGLRAAPSASEDRS